METDLTFQTMYVEHLVILADINKVFATCRVKNTGTIHLFLVDKIYGEIYVFCTSTHSWQELKNEKAHRDILAMVSDALRAGIVPVYVLRGESRGLDVLLGK